MEKPMRLRLLTATVMVVATVLALATPAAAGSQLVEFTDKRFVPSSVVLDPIQLNTGSSLAIHNGSSQDVVFSEQPSGLSSFTPKGVTSGWEFDAAGTYGISSPQVPRSHLMVGVPMHLEAVTRAGITVRWSSHAAPDETAPVRFDVQWRTGTGEEPGQLWHDFAVQTANVAGTFVPPHPGHYAFRARLCENASGLFFCSLWSPNLHTRV
jgi:hypothetical protein